LLEGVVFVLSGFQNPKRAQLAVLAAEMGAVRLYDGWEARATHLITAYPNTPKHRDMIASGHGNAVKATWIEKCHSDGIK
jgi:DNA-repair protein XRCC1